MNYSSKKENVEFSKNSYHTNSFRGTKLQKPEEKIAKLLESLNPKPMLIFENKDKTELTDQKKVKPKLLTSKLPSAFHVNNKVKKNENNFYEKDSVKLFSDPHENKYVSLTEEAYSPKSNLAKLEEKALKLPAKLINLEEQSRNSSKSTKSDPKSNSQNQFLSDNDCIDRIYISKEKYSTENIKKKYFSPEINPNEIDNLLNFDFCSINNDKKIRNPKTHDSFFPKIKNKFSEAIDCLLQSKYNSNKSVNNCLIENDCPYKDIKLEDCITLNILKTSYSKIKKMLYVNRFEILIIKEIPISSKSFNSYLKEKIIDVKQKFSNSNKFVKIYKEYLNNPEGCLSVVMEYMNGFSLLNTIENCGCINEPIIKNITMQIVDCLEEHRELVNYNYGEITLCDILLNKQGIVKLIPNIFKIIKYEGHEFLQSNKCSSFDIFHQQNKFLEMKSLLYNNSDSKMNNNFLGHNDANFNNYVDNSNQFFYLGYMLIISCLGGLKFNHFEYIEKNINIVVKEIKLKKICCFFHLLIHIDNNFATKLRICNIINEKLFSNKFIDFLCLLTNFNKEKHKDITIKMLKNHIWFKESITNGNINLIEVIQITREWKKNKLLNYDSRYNNFENSLNMIISKNMEYYKDSSNIMNYKSIYTYISSGDIISFIENKKKILKEISYDLLIQPNYLDCKLKEIISEYF